MQLEDSGTSNSSIIINSEEAAADNSLKKTDDDKPLLVTRQLFPVTTGDVAAPAVRPAQGLNLSYAQSTGGGDQELKAVQHVNKRRRGPRSRSSQYRGVTFYRRTGRWESHIWDCGKQVYLGGFDTAHAAARVYDRAAIKFRGNDADLNFSLSDYEEDMKQLKHLSKEEFVLSLRRQTNGFARGSSKYRGIILHKCGKWEARMEQLLGMRAYDKASIKYNGREAVNNFEPSAYQGEMLLDFKKGSRGYHNLDLSLGISKPSSTGPVRCDACEMPNKERPVFEGSVYTPMELQIHPNHHVLTMAPQSYEKRDKEKRAQSVSLSQFTNWAWEMRSNGNVAPMPVLSSNAASSGFSSSTACNAPPHPATTQLL